MNQIIEKPIVNLTPQAVENVKKFMGDKPEGGLRLGVRGGGCSGFQYAVTLDFAKEDDIVFEQDGLQVAIAKEAFSYIKGSTLDYKETIEESGFVFDNPNATGGCGCGSSFRVDNKEGCDTSGKTLDEEEIYGV